MWHWTRCSRKLAFSSVSDLTDVSSLVRLFSFLIFAYSNWDSSLEILTTVSYFSVRNKVFSSCNCLILSRNFSTSGCLSCLMFSFLQILSRSCWNTSDWVLRLSITGLSEFSIYFEKLIWSCCRRADWDLFIEDKASVNAFCKMTISVVCCDGTFIALFSAFCSVFTLVTFMLYVLVLAFSSWKCHC
jgi:hypothetical protein